MSDKKPRTIFRTGNRENPFAQIRRDLLQDWELSNEARGILVAIMSLPDDWEFDLKWLTAKAKIGRDKGQRVVREFIDRGYCRRLQNTASGGKFDAVIYQFSDDRAWASPQPDFQAAVTQDVVGPQPDFPVTGSTGAGKSGHRHIETKNKLDNSKKGRSPTGSGQRRI